MAKTATKDHGKIIHFAGAHHLFPVAKKAERAQIRLSADDAVAEDETRIGWDAFFRAFIDGGLAFVHDEAEGRPVKPSDLAEALR
jgi:hypothetical protein